MTIDEALKQLSFVNKKGAGFVRDTILEAQNLAITEHNVEFKSNLWIGEDIFIYIPYNILVIHHSSTGNHQMHWQSTPNHHNLISAESFSGKGTVIKGVRRHARGRMGEVRYQYSHYFVRLEEGKPPKDYYNLNPLTPQQQLDKWLENMRERKIINSY